MKKILTSMLIFGLTISFVTGCEENKNTNNSIENNDMVQEENQLDGNYQNVTLLLSDETTDSIKITFNADRFAVEEYYLMEPQTAIYFTDMSNGNNYLVYAEDNYGSSTEEYYNKLVNNAKRNIKSDDLQITEMEDISYGGITFKKFTASWSEEYEYSSKETGELVSGKSNNDETAIFAEIQSGIFLRYDGPYNEEILENLFVKIIK